MALYEKGIAEFVAKCRNCKQVKVEHQKPNGLAKKDRTFGREVGDD